MLVRLADEAASFLPYGAAPQLRASLGLTYGELALLLVAIPAGGVVGLACSVLADVVSRRMLATVSTAALATSMAAFALSESLAVLVVAGFVYGAASDGMVSACEVALADETGDDLDRALARTNRWGMVGDVCGPLLLAAGVATGLGPRAAFGAAAAGLALYAWWLGSLPLPAPRAPGREQVPARVAALLRDRRVWLLGALAACLFPLDEALVAVLALRFAQGADLAPAGAVVAAAQVAGGLVGLAVAPRAIATRGHRAVLAGGAAVAAVAVLPAATGPAALALLGALGAGLGVAAAWIAFQALLLRLHPGSEGATTAVVGLVELGGLAIPLLAGVVADAHGLAAAVALYAVAALVAVPLALLAVAPSEVLRRPSRP